MRKLFKERKLFKGGNYMRKYGTYLHSLEKHLLLFDDKSTDLIKKEDFGTELYVLEDQQRRSQRSLGVLRSP